jgi:hypothetical protein
MFSGPMPIRRRLCPLAAQTETTRAEPTRTIALFDGEIEMHIFAGLEAGVLRIGSEERK